MLNVYREQIMHEQPRIHRRKIETAVLDGLRGVKDADYFKVYLKAYNDERTRLPVVRLRTARIWNVAAERLSAETDGCRTPLRSSALIRYGRRTTLKAAGLAGFHHGTARGSRGMQKRSRLNPSGRDQQLSQRRCGDA